MSLPEITAPAGVPVFLYESHGIQESSVFANVPMRTGHGRLRRLYTVNDRVVTVSWSLDARQMALVHDWFENVLIVGSQFFSAQVKDQGSRALLWWKAKWLAPYTSEPTVPGRWRVTGTLQLFGEGSLTGPVSSGLSTSFGMALKGNVVLTVNQPLLVAFGLPLIKTASLSVAFGLPLLPVSHGLVLREDGFFVLREDGSYVLREQ